MSNGSPPLSVSHVMSKKPLLFFCSFEALLADRFCSTGFQVSVFSLMRNNTHSLVFLSFYLSFFFLSPSPHPSPCFHIRSRPSSEEVLLNVASCMFSVLAGLLGSSRTFRKSLRKSQPIQEEDEEKPQRRASEDGEEQRGADFLSRDSLEPDGERSIHSFILD